uniref:Uncharacterized protein n=1 Tax=Arundo donax TaxID=35708 RepID=A0A0A8ZWK9_ARUDO
MLRKQRNDCVFQAAQPNMVSVLHAVRDDFKLWCMAGAHCLVHLLARLQ